jgi:hypothetical protein
MHLCFWGSQNFPKLEIQLPTVYLYARHQATVYLSDISNRFEIRIHACFESVIRHAHTKKHTYMQHQKHTLTRLTLAGRDFHEVIRVSHYIRSGGLLAREKALKQRLSKALTSEQKENALLRARLRQQAQQINMYKGFGALGTRTPPLPRYSQIAGTQDLAEVREPDLVCACLAWIDFNAQIFGPLSCSDVCHACL